MSRILVGPFLALLLWSTSDSVMGNSCGLPARFRACPFSPAGLEVTRGIGGHCPVGEPLLGECVSDEDCFLKRRGNICCYNRCRGMSECHQFP